MRKIMTAMLLCFGMLGGTKAQQVAVKTNLLYDATSTINLGVEAAINRHFTVDVSGNYNPWTFSADKSIKHWLVQPELRYWVFEKMNGHFFGLHAHYGQMDTSGKPFLFGIKSDYGYDGYLYGAGVSYGYQLYLSPRWNIEFAAGFGYTYLKYDKYRYPKDEVPMGKYQNNYWGLTKAGISVVYIIK